MKTEIWGADSAHDIKAARKYDEYRRTDSERVAPVSESIDISNETWFLIVIGGRQTLLQNMFLA